MPHFCPDSLPVQEHLDSVKCIIVHFADTLESGLYFMSISSLISECTLLSPLSLSHAGVPCFIMLRFIIAHWRDRVFCRLKICGHPASSKSVSAVFPTAFAHFIPQCRMMVICAIFQNFIICHGDQWSLMLLLTTHWRLRWWLVFFF